VGEDKNKLREEVEHFIEEYDELDDERLEDLLITLLLKPYPSRLAQDG
jgi:hypothetical protein